MFYRLILTTFSFVFLFITDTALAWKMEADTMVVNNTTGGVITHIDFRQTYNNPPLVFTLATHVGGDPSALRVINVSTTGFDVYSTEPDGNDGPHARMTAVPYIAIEEGNHTFPDGTKIIAGKINTQKFQSKFLSGSSWENVSLSGFNTSPTILSQIQTRVNERTDLVVPSANPQPWMTTSISNVSNSGFDLALGRAETTSGTLTSNESVAYLAIDSGLNGGNHYFGSNGADKIEYESIRSNDVIQGWSDSSTGYSINFSKTYSTPIVVSTINTRDEDDGGWLRRKSISGNSIYLVVEEDRANDTERNHTTERVGILLFSESFDAEFIYSGQAEMIINEVMYNEVSTGLANDEFVELYVISGGNTHGAVISDQDTHSYTFPSQAVNTGDYVIYHPGSGTNSSSAGAHHFYQGGSNILNNSDDDVALLQPSQDVTSLNDGSVFNAIPIDYMAYGRSSIGSNVDPIPSSMLGATLSWNYGFGAELGDAVDGESIALTKNATDSDQAACWEITASGNAGDNSCSSYLITVANSASFNNSLAKSNTSSPIISLAKTILTIYDPYNGASNPKAIPGSVLEYIITAKNDGYLAVDDNTISITDHIPNNTKLCVQDNYNPDGNNCRLPYFEDISTANAISLDNVTFKDSLGSVITPSPDSDGADNNVASFQASMNGILAAKTGSIAPSFSLKFRVIVE